MWLPLWREGHTQWLYWQSFWDAKMPRALTSGLGWRLSARLVPSGSGSIRGILLMTPSKCTQKVNHKRLIPRNSHLLTTKLQLVPSFAGLLYLSPAPQGLDQGQLWSASPHFPKLSYFRLSAAHNALVRILYHRGSQGAGKSTLAWELPLLLQTASYLQGEIKFWFPSPKEAENFPMAGYSHRSIIPNP